MTSVAPIASTADASATAARISGGTVGEAQDRFLTLLVSQLKNQDPLNPLDNAQITSQLAQLSTVTGINRLNATLEAMAASADARQYLQAANLVGHDVVIEGNGFALREGKGEGAFDLLSAAEQVSVTITDAAGRAVRTIELGAQEPGVVMFEWDGRDDAGAVQKDGRYSIAVRASAGGKDVSALPLGVARVNGIVPGEQGGKLQLDSLGTVLLADVKLIN